MLTHWGRGINIRKWDTNSMYIFPMKDSILWISLYIILKYKSFCTLSNLTLFSFLFHSADYSIEEKLYFLTIWKLNFSKNHKTKKMSSSRLWDHTCYYWKLNLAQIGLKSSWNIKHTNMRLTSLIMLSHKTTILII